MIDFIVILGPTATGKTNFAVKVANKFNGEIIRFEEEEPYIPVFINEAAYVEKNMAMSFTKRELWDFKKEWKQTLIDLVHQK